MDKLRELARNLWWTWQPNVIALFRELDPALWRKVDHNPVEFLKRLPVDQLERRAAEMALDSRIDYAFRRLAEYLKDTDSWGAVHASILRARPVAYFSAEFGLHESLPIYSGGLGVLAGDHLKSASDLGIPLIAIGLLYAQGYFRQSLDASGWQQEQYLNADLELLPIESVSGPDGKPLLVAVETDHGRPAREGLAGGGRPDHAPAARRQCPREQRVRPVAHGAALRRRRPDPHPPGAAPGRRRRPGAARAGDHPVGPAPERGPQRVRDAGDDPPAGRGERAAVRRGGARRRGDDGLHHPHAGGRRPRPVPGAAGRGAPGQDPRGAAPLVRRLHGPGSGLSSATPTSRSA